jgi:hypothetical protein
MRSSRHPFAAAFVAKGRLQSIADAMTFNTPKMNN